MKRKQYEEKFDVDVTDDPITGETKVQDRIKDEVGFTSSLFVNTPAKMGATKY